MGEPFTLLLVQMGGTIDKDYPRTRQGYSFEIGEAASSKILQRMNVSFKVERVTVCKKDSQDITDEDREQLCEICRTIPHNHILVTHGTDTLLQTAAFLARHRRPQHTIVLTGAFKPHTFKDTDAEFNVGVAVGALQAGLAPGVYVTMNGGVYPLNKVQRDPHTDFFVYKSS